MKIIDMHTHAQDILFPDDAPPGVRPSLGILVRFFEWQRFNWYGPAPAEMKGTLRDFLRKWGAKETQRRNAMASFDALGETMDRVGVTHSVVLPIEPYGNSSEVLSEAKKDKRWIPFASVDPCDPRRAEKLKRFAADGCRGLKLHPIIQDFHPSGQDCMETVEEFRQYELPIFFHSGQHAYYVPESESETYGAPENYLKTFEAFPDVRFVMGHMAMFEAEQAIEVGRKCSNVYFDTSFQPIKTVKKAIDEVGEERIMFGTDWPFGRQHVEFSIIMKLTEGNPALREKLFFKNAEALVGEVG